jgi:hypothetical protein
MFSACTTPLVAVTVKVTLCIVDADGFEHPGKIKAAKPTITATTTLTRTVSSPKLGI